MGSIEAGIEEYHAEPNAQSPVSLFRSNTDDAWENEMMTLPARRQGQWHRKHLEESIPHGGLRGKEPCAKRQHITSLTNMDIKKGSFHPSFRRR